MSFNLKESARRLVLAMGAVSDVMNIGDGGDDVLNAKLEECRVAPVVVLPGELERWRGRAADARNEIERGAFEWKAHALRFQIEQAARVATERLRLFDSLKTEADYEAEKEKCRLDTLYWFQMYAWGYDPRAALKVVPFSPYPRQAQYLRWLDETVFDRVTSGIVEKSRDEGATVGALDWVVKHWLYVPGFSAFLSSHNEDLIDSSKDPDTLFEKIRFQLRLTPSWMLPKGFSLKRDMPYMNIHNPQNGANIGGGAPTVNVGRQRRATIVLADEFQSWPNGGFQQSTALSQTAFSVIKLGTPFGAQNQYYVETHSEGANVFVMDWHDNPVKDERWYRSLPFGYIAPMMNTEAIAQEVDRNYDASQPGLVFKTWVEREPYVLITWAELVAYYKQFRLDKYFYDETGGYRVPFDWNWGRMQDYGQTEAHKWIISFGARPRENYPLSDSFFVFGYIVAPTGSAVGEVQPLIEERQNSLGLVGEPELSEASHEQGGEEGVIKTFMDEHGEEWRTWNTDYTVGIPQIQEWLMLVDTTLPNPIRPQLVGRTRLYFVCMGEIKLAHNAREGKYFVTPSPSEASFKLARAEMKSYHYPREEMGKPLALMRPEKKKGMDNFIDTLRAFATKWGPSVAPMSKGEKRIAALPDYLKPAALEAARGTRAYVELYSEQQQTLKQAELRDAREEKKEIAAWAKAFGGRPVSHGRRRR